VTPAPNPSLPPDEARRAPQHGGPPSRGGAGGSRIAAARERVELAKVALASIAVAAFGFAIVVVRGTHPGHASSASGSSASSVVGESDFSDDSGSSSSDDGFGFDGGGTLAPAQSSAPVVTSGAS